jgi:alanyl-tRNA synthetase
MPNLGKNMAYCVLNVNTLNNAVTIIISPMLTSSEIRTRFLEFFKKRGHAIIPSASLVPQNDPSVLFNTAGMQPLVPYLLGEPHPAGVRLADSQKCVRTQDIEEVGDNTHDTFFEMLGNWSLGDYFKKDAINWSYEFLTSKEEGLGLDPSRLYVTVFGGNQDAPKDDESYAIWKGIFDKAGVKGERIYFMTTTPSGKEPNWWSAGDSGPCGPDTEMFYDVTGKHTQGLSKEAYMAADDRQEIVEIWNDVFMEYLKKDGVVVGKLEKQNVDTGSGLERVTMMVQGKDNIFATDMFSVMMKIIADNSTSYDERAARIVADHIRTSVFIIADGVTPSNTDQGYILRRLLRRAVRYSDVLGKKDGFDALINEVATKYKGVYENIAANLPQIKNEISGEEEKFRKTLENGMKEFERFAASGSISGANASMLYQSFGFPFEITKELADERKITVDEAGYKEEMKKHQDLSRSGSEQKFKGGLADHSVETVQLHTAHHLLLRALQLVLDPDVHQRGSNITAERLRIDFAYPQKMTDEQKREVERIVNEKIAEDLPVLRTEMSLDDAEKLGAEHEFGAKYPERVSVYSVGPKDATPENPQFDKRFSIEFCGGPHVTHTGALSHFRILKEEAVAQGIRRIKAVLE